LGGLAQLKSAEPTNLKFDLSIAYSRLKDPEIIRWLESDWGKQRSFYSEEETGYFIV
jgi:hypothetical protein